MNSVCIELRATYDPDFKTIGDTSVCVISCASYYNRLPNRCLSSVRLRLVVHWFALIQSILIFTTLIGGQADWRNAVLFVVNFPVAVGLAMLTTSILGHPRIRQESKKKHVPDIVS